MTPRYTNAAEVLPEELLAAVREKVGRGGCFLWIPAAGSLTRARRNELVAKLYAEGHSTAAIADRLFISQRTVFRVLAKARARSANSTDAPGTQRTAESDGTDDLTTHSGPNGPREV